MALPKGGLAASKPPQIGLASTHRPRSVNRRQTPRGRKIARSVREQHRARAARNGGARPPIGAHPAHRGPGGGSPGFDHDRAVLERVYGPNWPAKVLGTR